MKTQKKHKQDTSPKIIQRDKIDRSLGLKFPFELTDTQKKFMELATNKNTKILICKGYAGTAKTLLSVYVALLLLNNKSIGEILYTRNPVESSRFSMGYLPGESSEKMLPYIQPLLDKLNELLPKGDVLSLLNDERVFGIPIGFLRGRSFNASVVIGDESQNLGVEDLLLIMSRMGKFSKLFLLGDIQQPDIKHSGFEAVYNLFDSEECRANGIYTFEFKKTDIMRSDILAFILDKFETLKR